MRSFLQILFFLHIGMSCWAQNDSIMEGKKPIIINQALDPLAPSKAAFYSTVVPGLGQYYNKSYWKIPIVYTALGTSTYFYFHNQKQYTTWRNEYKKRLLGIYDTSHPVFGRLDNDRLIRGQKLYQRYRDLSLIFIIGFYVLNIVDANVDAHLQQFNVDDDLSFSPYISPNTIDNGYHYGFQLSFKF